MVDQIIPETPKPQVVYTDDPNYKVQTRSPAGTLNGDDWRRLLRSLGLVLVAGVTTWIGTIVIPYITADKDWWDDLAVAGFGIVIMLLNSLKILIEGIPAKK